MTDSDQDKKKLTCLLVGAGAGLNNTNSSGKGNGGGTAPQGGDALLGTNLIANIDVFVAGVDTMAATYDLGLDSILSSPKIQVTAPLVIEASQLAIFPADACSPTGLNNVKNFVPKGDCGLSIKDRAYI